MRISRTIFDFVFSFGSVFVVCCLMTLIWNVTFHSKNAPDWGAAVSLGIMTAIVYAVISAKDKYRQ